MKYQYLILILVFGLIFSKANGQIIPDGSFNPVDTGNGYGDGLNGHVNFILSYPSSNKVLVLGSFTSFNGKSVSGAVRLLDSIAAPWAPFDDSFEAEFEGGEPRKAILQPDEKIIVIGDFTECNNILVSGLVRLNSDGSLDNSFFLANGSGAAGGAINDIAMDNTGNIFLAGSFLEFDGLPRKGLAKLNSSGALDPVFFLAQLGPVGGTINAIEVAGGKLLAGGAFSEFNGLATNRIARLSLTSGVIDAAAAPFSPITSEVVFIKLLSGSTNRVAILSDSAGSERSFWLTQMDAAMDTVITATRFNLGSSETGALRAIFPEPAGLIIGGSFSFVNSQPRSNLARLLWLSGQPDPSFMPVQGCNGAINCINRGTSISASAFFIGGEFRKFLGFSRSFAARINATATASSPLSKGSGVNGGAVYTSLITPDNKILIGGEFGYFNWSFRNGISRLLSDGNVDPSFAPGAGVDGSIHAISVQPDGKILAGGVFSTFNNIAANGLVRLHPNGTIDLSFSTSGTTDSVLCMAVQPDGKILVGGSFTSFGGLPFNRIVRLNSNGSIDGSFLPGTGFDGIVRTISLYKDSLIFAGGDFSVYDGNGRNGIVCLLSDGSFLPSSNPGSGLNAGGRVRKIAISQKKEVFAGGLFNDYNGDDYSNLVKFDFNGISDAQFDPQNNVDGEVFDILVESGRRGIILAGNMGNAKAGGPRRGIIKLKPKGSKDLSIGNGLGGNGPVFSLKRDSTGKLIISGNFTKFDTVGKNRILRLLENPLELTIWDGHDWDWGDPDCDFDALIAGHYQTIGFNCRNLTILPSKKFYPSAKVVVCGNAYSYTSLITGEVYLAGSSLQDVEGTFFDLSLDNASGAQLTYAASVAGTLKLWSGNFQTNNLLTLKSTSARTGRLAMIEPGASLGGKITMERFVSGGSAGWHFLGTPVKGQVQADWSDDFLILPTFMYRHNEASNVVNGWEQSNDSLKVGKGFRVYLNQPFFNAGATFRNTGIPHTGPFSFTVSFTPTGYNGGGWNFLANPYPCEIDWHDFSRTNIGNQVHYWNGTQYASYSSGTMLGVNGGGRYIPSSQSFFVKAFTTSPALSVTETAKPVIPQNPGFYRVAADQNQEVARIRLLSSADESDETAIRWMPEAQPYFEPELDADKLSNPGLNLFSLSSEGKKASIQARNYIQGDSVPLGFEVQEPGTYFLEIQLGAGLMNGRTWKLKDNESGFSFPLQGSLLFPFTADQESLNSPFRFSLISSGTAVENNILQSEAKIQVFPNPGKGQFRVHGLEGRNRFVLQGADGRLVCHGISDGILKFDEVQAGVYFLSFPESKEARKKIRLVILP